MGGACVVCGNPTAVSYGRVRKTCSEECKNIRHSRTMTATNKVYASPRMLARNPMRRQDVREQVSATHRARGHQPKFRGGNRTALPIPQQKLLSVLGEGWVAEHSVGTGSGARERGMPTHYSIDIAHPDLKIAVEIDGGSHSALSRQLSDARKDAWLAAHGWRVLRFTNQEVMADASAVCKRIRA